MLNEEAKSSQAQDSKAPKEEPVVVAHIRFSKDIRKFMYDHNVSQSDMLKLLQIIELHNTF